MLYHNMVSARLLQFPGNILLKQFRNTLLLPSGPPDAIALDYGDLDFSDKNSVYEGENHVDLALNLRKLTLCETEVSLELVEGVGEEANGKLQTYPYENVVANDIIPSNEAGIGDFEVLKVVGQGGFGKVLRVKKIDTSEIFAMKVMRKDKILEKNNAEYMIAERDILARIYHPFIVQLRYSFQTKYRLYLILDFVNGGHLFFHIYRQGLFREELALVYTAEIVSAVSYLHAKGITHRDLKPENILLDAEGHVVLTDFGLAKQFDENTQTNSKCGTLEYMAPEIIQGKGYDKAADWWSVGVLLFEMLTGKSPFHGGNRQKVQQKIVKDKIKLPAYLSSEAHSLLKGLLQKDPVKRLGSGARGGDEIKGQKWFKSINWKKLEAREIKPNFIPVVVGKQCTANFDEQWTRMPPLDSPAASPKCGENPFKDFTCVNC